MISNRLAGSTTTEYVAYIEFDSGATFMSQATDVPGDAEAHLAGVVSAGLALGNSIAKSGLFYKNTSITYSPVSP